MNKKDQSDQIKELWEYIIKTGNDPDYQKEGKPAFLFSLLAPKVLDIKFHEMVKNENDPPDFLLRKEEELTNLEITSLADEFYWQKNAFFKKVEMIASDAISKNKHFLPNGIYMIFYIPTSQVPPPKPKFWIPLPDFKHKIKRHYLMRILTETISQWFKDYNNDNTCTRCPVRNRKGKQIGEFILSRFGDCDEVRWILMPQRIYRNKEWCKDDLQTELQKRIDEKSDQYKFKTGLKEKYPGNWWLLIADVQNFMNTHYFNFNIADIEVKSAFFDRVFFIPGVIGKPRFYEICISKN